jgi:hydrogenase maturation protease
MTDDLYKGAWDALRGAGPEAVEVDGVAVSRGSRVRLHPRAGGDVFDLALAGRTAVVESLEEDLDGGVQLAVTVDDDPGRDLGDLRQPGHRFFFTPAEVEPLPDAPPATPEPSTRVLVAGIGNVFLGDDGFGVVLAHRLAERALPAGVDVVDFGIRGMDLAYALHDGYDAVVLLDATPRGDVPGTLYVIEPELDDAHVALDAHGMDPVKVLGLARELGGPPPRTLVVGCEPLTRMTGDEEDVVADVSEPVQAALDDAVTLVETLLADLTDNDHDQKGIPT